MTRNEGEPILSQTGNEDQVRKTRFAAVAAIAITALLAGCAAQGGGAETGDGDAVGADTSAIVAAANEKVTEYSAAGQEFPVPTEPFVPGVGKATVVNQGAASATGQLNAERAADAFNLMGWTVKGPLDGKFSAPTVGGFLDAAVVEDQDAVVIVSVTLADVGQSVKNAIDAGVIVACIMCSYDAELANAGVIYSSIDFTKQGEILAWHFIDASAGTGKIASVKDPGVASTTMRAEGVTRIINENCATCEVLDDIVIPSSDIALPGPPQWSAYLNAHAPGSVDYVNSMADVVGIPMAKTLESIGRDDITIGGFDADAEAIEMIRSGESPFAATVALPYYWASWAAVDLVARQKAGVATYDASQLPMQLIYEANVAEFDEFVPEGDWQGAFKTTWGVA